MIDILQKMNKDKDRCILIGRNAFNYHLNDLFRKNRYFNTMDYDIVCPDLQTAKECQTILEEAGFTKENATFRSERGELDVLIADPQYTESIIGDYYNIPSLRPLWDDRERKNGVLSPAPDKLILNKLLHARENEGRDTETVSIYLSLHPEKLDSLLNTIDTHKNPEEREKMLFSLYESLTDLKEQRKKVERVIISDIERNQQINDKTVDTVTNADDTDKADNTHNTHEIDNDSQKAHLQSEAIKNRLQAQAAQEIISKVRAIPQGTDLNLPNADLNGTQENVLASVSVAETEVKKLQTDATSKDAVAGKIRKIEAIQATKGIMGINTIVTSAANGVKYQGDIIAKTDTYAIQRITNNQAVLHEIKNISDESNLEVGSQVTLHKNNDKTVQVKEKDSEQEIEEEYGRERGSL